MEDEGKASIMDSLSREKTGLDALSEPVLAPDGSRKHLQFQWMRLHPSTCIALSDDDENATSVKVSRMLLTYQAALSTNEPKRPAAKSPFLFAPDVCVDPCDLFDPPLVSTNICIDKPKNISEPPTELFQDNSGSSAEDRLS